MAHGLKKWLLLILSIMFLYFVIPVPSLSEDAQIAISEFQSLAESAGITVMDTVVQRRPKPDPKYVVGKGKVLDIYIRALALDANLLIFDHELSPSQARSIADIVDMRVIDRTQLILDIFAQRARTREGKILVQGDEIMVGTQRARVVAVDRERSALRLDRSVRWSRGTSVSYPYEGAGPDVGAREARP
jgi:50S ribosomal subunit-associated GTPase HflX